jgi:hypothetical protein
VPYEAKFVFLEYSFFTLVTLIELTFTSGDQMSLPELLSLWALSIGKYSEALDV